MTSSFKELKSWLDWRLHPSGKAIAYGAAAGTLILYLLSDTLGCLAALITLYLFYLYRDPKRVVPSAEGMILAHADGVVTSITSPASLPESLASMVAEDEREHEYQKISIYISLLHNHVNRAPVSGTFEKELFIPGEHGNSLKPESAEHNERSIALMRDHAGHPVIFSQIAGMITRTVLCSAYEGEVLEQGDRYGIIRFGCRAELFVPAHYQLLIGQGSHVRAGETMVAIDTDHFAADSLQFSEK